MIDSVFIYAVYEIIKQIPRRKVTTYGQIAYMINRPKIARLVGTVLKGTDRSLDLPCHRVVNANGRLVPKWEKQRLLLEDECVPFKENEHVDLKRCFWQGNNNSNTV